MTHYLSSIRYVPLYPCVEASLTFLLLRVPLSPKNSNLLSPALFLSIQYPGALDRQGKTVIYHYTVCSNIQQCFPRFVKIKWKSFKSNTIKISTIRIMNRYELNLQCPLHMYLENL